MHAATDEARVLEDWLHRSRDCGALASLEDHHGEGALSQAVSRACHALTDGDAVLVLAHRDLHDGQLLWDGRQLTVLDLDTAASAEAALDLGNLWAHVDLIRVQDRLSTPAHEQLRDLLEALASRLPTSVSRLRAYYQAARLRLCLVHSFRPATTSWLPQWTAETLRNQQQPKGRRSCCD